MKYPKHGEDSNCVRFPFVLAEVTRPILAEVTSPTLVEVTLVPLLVQRTQSHSNLLIAYAFGEVPLSHVQSALAIIMWVLITPLSTLAG